MATIGNQRELGAAIRDRRSKLGWTQAELAERTGVTRDWVIDVEAGRANPQLRHLLRTLDALGLSLRVDSTQTTTTPLNAPRPRPGQVHKGLPAVSLDTILDEHRGRG